MTLEMVLTSFMVPFCFAFCMAVMALGMRRAAKIPIIATTIRSSINVKPFAFLFIKTSIFDLFKILKLIIVQYACHFPEFLSIR